MVLAQGPAEADRRGAGAGVARWFPRSAGNLIPAWLQTHYFPDLPRVVPAMRAMVAGLAHQLEAANGRFLKTFEDMRWSQAEAKPRVHAALEQISVAP
jgi:hypothetical protein